MIDDRGSIRLELDIDPTDGTAELFVAAGRVGFAGRASAWVSADHVAAFGAALAVFPLPAIGTPPLAVGYYGGNPTALEDEHVYVRAHPVDRRGTVAIEVRLAESPRDVRPPAGAQRAALDILTEYEPLRHFAADVTRLARGEIVRAQLGPDLPGW